MAQRTMFTVTAVLLCCVAASAKLFTLPDDVPLRGGHAVTSICLDCCQAGSYCGKTLVDEYIPRPSNVSEQILVKKGTNMTCVMRARNVVGAVDGGLCVPDTFNLSAPVAHFCQNDKKNFAPSFNLTEVIYQANLTIQATDKPCCDGLHLCDAFSTCRPTTGFKKPSKLTLPKAVCIASTARHDTTSMYHLDMKHKVLCETCDKLSPAARAVQNQNSGTPGSSTKNNGASGSTSNSGTSSTSIRGSTSNSGTSARGTGFAQGPIPQ